VRRVEGRENKEEAYIHGDGYHHELCIKADERFVLCESMVVYQPLVDDSEEEVVQSGINEEDEDLGGSVPVGVDLDEAIFKLAKLEGHI
jgi:hypothetical protein